MGLIRSIIDVLVSIIFAGSLSLYGLKELHDFVKKEALTKVSCGLGSMSKFTNALTCQKFDEKMNLVPLNTRHCKKRIKK